MCEGSGALEAKGRASYALSDGCARNAECLGVRNMQKLKIVQGHIIPALSTLPTDYVDCIVTSPPYWGLRDYGEETVTIWDAEGGCEHEWGKDIKAPSGEHHHGQGSSTLRGGNVSPEENWNKSTSGNKRESQFCQKCGAFRGQLGLEPSLELYLNHLLQVTAELKRVLKPTGVMFLNFGSSYSNGKAKIVIKEWYD